MFDKKKGLIKKKGGIKKGRLPPTFFVFLNAVKLFYIV